MIPISKPFLPPLEEYNSVIKEVWDNYWLTNVGPISIKLEANLEKHLKVKNLLFVTNGTIALQIAIKALEIKGEIITTPFSFIATTSSIVWEGCTPIFVDINKHDLNIDPEKIEEAITPNTKAIIATHVYGNPCDVVKIEKIAKKYNLKVIYDGAHAFDVKINGKSIFLYGDISTCSLHASKIYHSIEGGFVVVNNTEFIERVVKSRNFGFESTESFSHLGINGKNSEFHAAMGLVNIKYINQIHEKRKLLVDTYDTLLSNFGATQPIWASNSNNNYAYYPLIFESEEMLLKCAEYLKSYDIFTRRYFYPSLSNSLPYVQYKNMPVTEEVAKKVLCLPLYYELNVTQVENICTLMNNFLKLKNHL